MGKMGKKKKCLIISDLESMRNVMTRLGYEQSSQPDFVPDEDQNEPFRFIKDKWTVEFGGGIGRVTDWQVFDDVYALNGTGHGFYGHGKGAENLYKALCELPDDKEKAS